MASMSAVYADDAMCYGMRLIEVMRNVCRCV